MNSKIGVWAGVLLLVVSTIHAQTDALVVDDNGLVGVVLIGPSESLQVTANLEPPFVDLPRRCQRGIPVKIIISEAGTGAVLLEEQQVLSGGARSFTAELLPSFGGIGTRVQIGVMTSARLTRCMAVDVNAASNAAIRRIEPDRVALEGGKAIAVE